TAGQIAIDPGTKEIVGEDVAAQTEQVMKNLAAILEAAGTSLAGVVKTTVFLSDMADFAAMNEVYARHFGDHKPARSTVQAAALPRNVKVEAEAVARLGGYASPPPARPGRARADQRASRSPVRRARPGCRARRT